MNDAIDWEQLADERMQQILLVDDRDDNLAVLDAILSDCGAALLQAKSGEAALEVLYREEVALVLLDVNMPGMDGFEVLRAMRANRRTRETPTIFVTAYARDEQEIVEGYRDGAIDFILKPVSAAVLRGKVQQFLELDRYKRDLERVNLLLEAQKVYYESMLNAADEGVLGLSPEGRVDFANPTALRLLAAEPDRLLGTHFTEIGHPPAAQEPSWENTVFYRYWKSRRALRLADTLLQRLDGAPLPVTLSCAPLPGANSGSVIIFQDISQRKKLEEQLRQQAVTDALTGLLNRHGLKQTLAGSVLRSARSGRHLALFFIDLDHFKDINDTLGHDFGDLVLKATAQRLKDALRAKDVIARLGGDEFTVIVDDLEDVEHAARVARKLLQAMEAPFELQDHKLSMGACIGIALFPDNCSDTDSLMLAADLAMYRAKSLGRNTFEFFTPELNARAKASMLLEQGIRHGLDQQEFYLDYQPQFDISGQRVVGLEALLRWRRNHVAVQPDIFIPLMEQTGQINRVGEWVLETAVRQRRVWQQTGLLTDDCPVAVNLSPRQFTNAQLVPAIARILRENGLAPAMLELEVTEGILMENTSVHRKVLDQLHELGVRLSIDDFGTGYSSLAYLIDFDIDALKIDKSFIDHIDTSEKDVAITASIIQLAHNLRLKVVAEGVESQAQLDILRRLGCDYVQGYLCAKPMAPEAVAQRFAAPQKP
ncbi:putative bifunctional diguanylate cyclase/phosphodiesterase [Paludibacterium purpuratum]|uniref:Response regulator receiver modulated diguanylate cyclase/phosphodiesterase n=1 Tax=Paludibacterium purpuratum TaxID=1144873 RepID=A0A4R7AZK0_9NEIS|nr:EAL domain-containing protein [Paludibacterium purpuratum]TDR73242.1 response regulator receiver modulated diguanylate cyclase/phosphodiesterase [Paludibacterium purpuratum]